MQISRRVISTTVLTVLALVGTVFHLPLFFGVDFLFGSIFTFIALRRFGLLSGLLVALVSGAYTAALWGHPYALLIFVAQACAIGIVQRRQDQGTLPQWVITFWLLFGLPFVALTYHFLLGFSWTGAAMVAFKQAINEVFNGLIAALLLQYLPRRGIFRHLERRRRGIQALQMDLLLAFAFAPAIVVMTINARFSVDSTLAEIQQRLNIRSTNLASQIAAWREDHWMRLQSLAKLGGDIRRHDLQLLRDTAPELLNLHVVGLDGRIKLTSMDDDPAIREVNYQDRPWFQGILRTHQPAVSDAILGRSSHQLSVALAVPILQQGQLKGMVVTAVAGDSLLMRITAGYQHLAGRITLVDSHGDVIGSTWPVFKPMQPFANLRGGLVRDREGPYYRLQPEENLTPIQAWTKSFYVQENNKDLNGWTLVVEQPMKPYADDLQKSYLAMFVASFALAVFALWLSKRLGRVLSDPMQLLSHATSDLGKSSIKPPELSLPESHITEIASLTSDFRQMAQRLHEQHMALIRANDELEARVNQRTLELQQRQNAIDEHAIVSIADVDGAIIYVNKKFELISGYSMQELVGENHRVLKSGIHPDSFFEEMWITISQGKPWHGQVCNRAKDGHLYWVASTIVPFLDANGMPVQYISIRTDISAIKETEEELIRTRDEAEQASLAKSQFLSSMSHELRTPLNAILGFAQLLELDDALNPDQLDNIFEIRKAGDHLLTLINDVLDLAKVESGALDLSLEPVEIESVVHECLGLVAPLARQNNIKLVTDDLKGWSVRADRTRLKQVILNLVSNAIKYNRPDGRVKISIQPQRENQLRIEVTDTGLGISPDKLDQLFVPFSRLGQEESAIEGTGIGLALTQRVTEMMGGTVGVQSVLGSGSAFWIELPDASSVIDEKNAQASASLEAAGIADLKVEQQYLVLYIEDNPANLRLVAQVLGTRPHIHLLTAHTPSLGIELARVRRPDLVLLDINMPEMDGFAVLQTLKSDKELCDLPVLAVTANAMPRDVERGKQAGFSDYVTKPIHVVNFLQLVESYLNKKVGNSNG